MKQIMFVLFVIILGSMACKDKKPVAGKDTEEQRTVEIVQDPAKDSAAIRTVITDFYNWYNKNYTRFQEYHLYSGLKKKDVPPYKINWDAVEKYQQFIRGAVPQLSEEFLANQKHFFQQCDSAFKADVEDDIPYGFDYDWYTNSQEDPEYTLELLNRDAPWNMEINGDRAEVQIGVTQEEGSTGLILRLKKEKDKWTITKIGGI